MFFHWGTKDKKLVDTIIDNALCPHCANNQFTIVSWVSYLHIYWIPIYIRSKKLIILCSKCNKPIDTNTIPEDFFKRIKLLAFPTHKIIPYFSGTFLILFILLMGLYLHFNDKNTRIAYITKPQVNDVYLVQLNKILKGENKTYGFLKLYRIKPNVLEFKSSILSFDKSRQAWDDLYNWKAYQDYYYRKNIVPISKLQLIKYEKNGLINSIERQE